MYSTVYIYICTHIHTLVSYIIMYETIMAETTRGPIECLPPEAMNTQEALADAAELIRDTQQKRRCTEGRGTEFYCPVLVLGGSYPGFLAAMMRMRYPAVVDMAYASSAPLRFYSQEVSQYEYYAKVSESAERSMKGCAGVGFCFGKWGRFLST